MIYITDEKDQKTKLSIASLESIICASAEKLFE